MNGIRSFCYSLLIVAYFLVGCASQGPVPVKPAHDPNAGIPKPDITFQQMQEMEKMNTGSYRLGAGDSITISVYGEAGLTRTVKIEPDGKFTFPLIGEVSANGKRVVELVEELNQRLAVYVMDAKTDITINEYAKNQFIVLGNGIASPGLYTIVGEMHLMDAIATAGAIRTIVINEKELSGGDLRRSYLSRDGKILPVDFDALLNRGDMSYNIRIQPGDIIYVPLFTSTEVFILGFVNNPTVIPFAGELSIVKAITIAGGFHSDARTGKVRVLRATSEKPYVFTIDVDNILSGKEKDFQLMPNDIVYVPERIL